MPTPRFLGSLYPSCPADVDALGDAEIELLFAKFGQPGVPAAQFRDPANPQRQWLLRQIEDPNPPRPGHDGHHDGHPDEDGAGPAAAGFDEGEGEGEGPRISMWKQAQAGYGELVNAIIRPPRMEYTVADLGPTELEFGPKRLIRHDVELKNRRGHVLQCSWWKFHAEDSPAKQLPCVIYLHGNAACRIAAFPAIRPLLSMGVTLFALDFSGSGLSGGDFVSLGFYEREDVEEVIAHLRGTGEVSTIALWGHSMGATTALLYGDRDPSIAALVLDSPFTDLMQLSNELVVHAKESGMWVPGIAVAIGRNMIRRTVRKKADFDPRDVSPISNCSK